jgi:Domain of unknown function (DUF1906)
LTSRGLDSNTPLTGHAECIAKEGFSFCCRYYKTSPSCLSKSEAIALSAAGLYIVTVLELEKGSPSSPAYFSPGRGLVDGRFALEKAIVVGQPEGSPIYFAVDFDAADTDLASITDYFGSVASAAGHRHPVGVYGSGLVCGRLLQTTPVSYAWLSMSMGWRGSGGFTGYNIRQTAGGKVCGVSVDFDESAGHGGGWRCSG